MKKSLIVLLIAVLAIGSVFAADPVISGSVSAKAVYDTDMKTFTISETDGVTATFTWTSSLSLATANTEKPYAVVAGSATYVPCYDGVTTKSYVSYKISTFKIVGEGWTLNFKPAAVETSFAKNVVDSAKTYYNAAIESATKKTTAVYDYVWDVDNCNAIAFTYDTVGTLTVFGSRTKNATTPAAVTEAYRKFAFQFESVSKALTDEVTVQGALGYSYSSTEDVTNTNKFGVSLKAAYVIDNGSLTVASDMGFTKVKDEDAEFNADIALASVYDNYTFDAYYATEATVAAPSGYVGDTYVIEDLFSVKATADLEAIDTKATVTATNLINLDDRRAESLSVSLENTSLDAHTFTLALSNLTKKDKVNIAFNSAVVVTDQVSANAGISCTIAKNSKPVVTAGVSYTDADGIYAASLNAKFDTNGKKFADVVALTYTASRTTDLYTASVSAKYNTRTTSNGYYYTTNYEGLYLNVNLKSTTLVQGATLSLDWTTNRIDQKKGVADFGNVTASCTVAF